MVVPLLDLRAQYESIKVEIQAAVAEVFDSQRFILGSKVQECEAAIAQYCDCQHAVGVSSGTDALLIALMAESIGPGDEVITSPYTFFATAGCVARTGATPVFADIDPITFNIDPQMIEAQITDRTKAIIPVHLFGQMADMDPIMEIAERRDLIVIEDAAQAIGAEDKRRRAGSIGHYGCFSFFPSKNLGAAGDGGMVVTNDSQRAERLKSLRGHGARSKYVHELVGGNFRLDTLQAAVVLVKLRHLDHWTQGRQRNANRYGQLFAQRSLLETRRVSVPERTTNRHVFNQYVIRAPRRDALREHLKSAGISTEIYYPRSLPEQACFAHLGYRRGDFPQSERAADETLALPIYPELTDRQLSYVVDKIREFSESSS
jgi:dTDP-4-amino-4,6-dideoxygalactose transaminase